MEPAPDPLAISASAPFPTIPAASSSRPRAARPRRHAAPFRSDHPAAASVRRSGIDLSRRPTTSALAQQEGSRSWGASRDASFVFGSGAAGAPVMTRSFSSGSGEALSTEIPAEVDKLSLYDGSGRRSDADASGGDDHDGSSRRSDASWGDDAVPVTNASDPFGIGTRGSNFSFREGFGLDSLHDQTEKRDEGSRAPSQTIQCEGAETRSLASPTCTDQDAPIQFARNRDSSRVKNSVDEGSFPGDGSEISAHDNVQQNVFVFGRHAGYRDTANATQSSISKVGSTDKDSATINSEQLNHSVAEGSTCTKFILRDAKLAFGSTNKNPVHSEPCEISPAVKFGSNSRSEDGSGKVSFIKLPYDFEAVAAPELTEHASFDEKSFTVLDHNVASMNKSRAKGMVTNRRAVMPNNFSSADQVPSLESVSRRSDHCSGKVSPEKRGNQAYAEGQLTKAEECYTHGINSFSPNEASRKALMLCYSNRAATRMSLGKMRDALSDCREATGIDPSFLKAQVRAANCLLALGDAEEAQKAFEMCLKSSHLSSLDHKIVEEASDGIQKAQKVSGFIRQSKEYLIKKSFDNMPDALQMISDALSISIYSDNLMAMKAEALLLAAGNEAFQSGKYLEAVEHYTTALLSNNESLRFLAVCFCNRAAAYQAMGQILDAISDCSLAIALDADYAKAISRRSSLYELVRDYDQAENDLRRLITLLEKQLQENTSMPSEKTESIRSNLNRANLRFSSLKRDARKGAPLNVYLILGIEPSSSAVDIKKAYRKAALRHHPDKVLYSCSSNYTYILLSHSSYATGRQVPGEK
nr:unnamed protein product [Digitaria exilis]